MPARTPQDTLDIQQVVVRYGFAIDDRDWDAFDEILTEDAVIDFRNHDLDPPEGVGPLEGRAEIVRQFRDVLQHPYQHMLVCHLIEDVSADEVVVRTKALFPMPDMRIADVAYRDVVVRTADGWRIQHKSLKMYH